MADLHQRPALDVLAELNRGKTKNELTEKLHDLIAACQDTGKKGELVLKLSVEKDPDTEKYDTPRMRVTSVVTVKKPVISAKPSLFYLTDDGNLSRTDPNQDSFEGMRAVPSSNDESTTIRKAN